MMIFTFTITVSPSVLKCLGDVVPYDAARRDETRSESRTDHTRNQSALYKLLRRCNGLTPVAPPASDIGTLAMPAHTEILARDW